MADIFDFEEIRNRKINDIIEACFSSFDAFLAQVEKENARDREIDMKNLAEVLERLKHESDDIGLLFELVEALPLGHHVHARNCAEVYKRILLLDPENGDAYSGLGSMYEELGEVGKAETCFLKSLALEPADTVAYNSLGSFYNNLGETGKAIEVYKRGIHITNNFMLKYSLGETYLQVKNYEEGLRLFEEVKREIQNAGSMDEVNKYVFVYVCSGIIACYEGMREPLMARREREALEGNTDPIIQRAIRGESVVRKWLI